MSPLKGLGFRGWQCPHRFRGGLISFASARLGRRNIDSLAARERTPAARPGRRVIEGLAARVHNSGWAKRDQNKLASTARSLLGWGTDLHKMTRSSPTRRVTRSRSRYSSSGMAYLRVTPNRSLKLPTLSLGVSVFCGDDLAAHGCPARRGETPTRLPASPARDRATAE